MSHHQSSEIQSPLALPKARELTWPYAYLDTQPEASAGLWRYFAGIRSTELIGAIFFGLSYS